MKIGSQKIIDGRRFIARGAKKTKPMARNFANGFRKIGLVARIFPAKAVNSGKKIFVVFTGKRKKRRG